ncbi:MAG TPA: GTPase HflX [Nitrososphaeraceae archaeon]|nr:GTPase HflX [Nitrososphaeraceae archaeon]
MKNLTKVILVTYPDSFRLEEAKSLAESLQNKIVKVFTQKYLDRAEYGMGSGKAEEIKHFVKEHSVDEIQELIVDEHLTTRQIHNLEKLTELQVIDRERLILNIFSSRATTTESKLQIELAEIKYQFPRVREASKIIAHSESPGKGGMGEYVVDVKLRELKRQMSFIQRKLEYARRKRELYHRQRMETNLPVVSLVGYTSSGKTTLFNLLTESNKEVSDDLFTTLSTATRSLKLNNNNNNNNNNNSKVLLVDTIGFISRLPHYMFDAFKSTLEESLGADLILLLIDSSEEVQDIRMKYSSCWTVLGELGVDRSKVCVILTKYDDKNMHSEKIKEIAHNLELSNPMVISSKGGYGIRKLKTMIGQMLLLSHHDRSAIMTKSSHRA